MSYKKLDILFGKIQTDSTTPITDPFTSSDFLQVAEGFDVDLKPELSPLKQITGGFGQSESVPGAASCDVKIKTYIDFPSFDADTTTATTPVCDPYLLSSGMDKTSNVEETAGIRAYVQKYTPGLISSAMTFEKHLIDGTTATRTMAGNVVFDFDIALTTGKPAELSLTGKGILVQPVDTTAAISGIHRLANRIGAVMHGSTATFMGAEFKLLKCTLKAGNKVDLRKDMSSDYGYSNAEVIDREASVTATVYCKADTSIFDDWMAGTISDMTISFGDQANSIQISSSSLQIKDIKKADDGGINTYEIQAQIIDNSWTLEFITIIPEN